jgi:GT2 family glycosyltransferase
MKLSVVIICWNDSKVILDCLKSICAETTAIKYEIIVSDNGSTDDSLSQIRGRFPNVRIIENGENLGFARGNNAGIQLAQGEYVLILNPDTIILNQALEKLIEFADCHPAAGAFGCRVLNPDGSFQNPARPIPSVRGYLSAAVGTGRVASVLPAFTANIYPNWDGRTERTIGYQSGCCVMFRSDLLKRLGGFDERFFYHFEESDLCFRVWQSGSSILFTPDAEIIHLGGQSVGRFPIRFAIETFRSAYRFFYKHYGFNGVIRVRRVFLLNLLLRLFAYKLVFLFSKSDALQRRLEMYSVTIKWNFHLEPISFITDGSEPDVGYQPLAPPPKMVETVVYP